MKLLEREGGEDWDIKNVREMGNRITPEKKKQKNLDSVLHRHHSALTEIQTRDSRCSSRSLRELRCFYF